jgi:hypothetical protein
MFLTILEAVTPDIDVSSIGDSIWTVLNANLPAVFVVMGGLLALGIVIRLLRHLAP